MFFHGDRTKKEIAITFDDGPSEETKEILKILKKYNVRATFFIVGKMIKGRKNIIEKIKSDGHEFGNHTFSHKRLWFKTKKFIEKDITMCDDELNKLGVTTNLFRFPGLKFGLNSLTVCEKLNKKIIMAEIISFNLFSYDWFRPWLKKRKLIKNTINTNKVVRDTLSRVKNGSILSFHDYVQESGPNEDICPILEKILPELINKKFKFVTVSMLVNNIA